MHTPTDMHFWFELIPILMHKVTEKRNDNAHLFDVISKERILKVCWEWVLGHLECHLINKTKLYQMQKKDLPVAWTHILEREKENMNTQTGKGTYKCHVAEQYLSLVAGEIEFHNMVISVPVHHLRIWDQKRVLCDFCPITFNVHLLRHGFWAIMYFTQRWVFCQYWLLVDQSVIEYRIWNTAALLEWALTPQYMEMFCVSCTAGGSMNERSVIHP